MTPSFTQDYVFKIPIRVLVLIKAGHGELFKYAVFVLQGVIISPGFSKFPLSLCPTLSDVST